MTGMKKNNSNHLFNTIYSDKSAKCCRCGIVRVSICDGERFLYVTENSVLVNIPECRNKGV